MTTSLIYDLYRERPISDTKTISVGHVTEENDCAGRKSIFIKDIDYMGEDAGYFELTPLKADPVDKLVLGTVGYLDHVRVTLYPKPILSFGTNKTIFGSFDYICDYRGGREAICQCGANMISDGWTMYCIHPRCPLTIATRLRRLIDFDLNDPHFSLDFRTIGPDPDLSFVLEEIGEHTIPNRPFQLLEDQNFWGSNYGSLEKTLMNKHCYFATQATFLVPSEFERFVVETTPFSNFDTAPFYHVRQFYGEMENIIQRRDYESTHQTHIIRGFLKCLAIEALSDHVIDQLLVYERNIYNVADPFLIYFYALTHPGEMIKSLGVHPLVAQGIFKEIVNRREEFLEIFSAYVVSKSDARFLIYEDTPF